MNTQIKDKEYIANTYGRFPVTITHGNGSLVYDESGKEYIDLSTGIAVNTFGIADKEWADAVYSQLTKVSHTSNLYYNAPSAELAKMLCGRTGMKKVFFSNSGAEANECAIKVARKYAQDKKGVEYCNIITLKNSFHGRTLTTLAATGQDAFHTLFLPLTEGFLYAEPNNIEDIKALIANNKCAAVMIEVVQGEGGVMPLDLDYVRTLREITEKEDILLICDEVQTGNGRTGALYGYMNYGITPDIVSTAKGLAGGLPLGAALLSEKVQNVLTPGTHGSTFGGNPACCAGALSVLSRITNELLCEVKEKEALIKKELQDADGIISVSGMGLMIGIETKRDAGEIISECIDKGVLVIKAKNKLRLLPALNIPTDMLKKALNVIKEAAAKC